MQFVGTEETGNQPDAGGEQKRMLGEIHAIASRLRELWRSVSPRYQQGFGQSQHTPSFNDFRFLERIDGNTSTAEMQRTLKIIRPMLEGYDADLRKETVAQSQSINNYLGGPQWKSVVEECARQNINRQFVDAVQREQKLFAQAVTASAGTSALCDRCVTVMNCIDRVYWELANSPQYPGRLLTLQNQNERITVAAGMWIQRNDGGNLIMRWDRDIWNSMESAGATYFLRIDLGSGVHGVSRLPEGNAWMLWDANGTLLDRVVLNRATEDDRKQGYALTLQTRRYTFRARPE